MLQKPSYQVKIGSTTFDYLQNPEIVRIDVDRDLNIPLDTFTLILKNSQIGKNVKNGDIVSIKLGYADSLALVMTGIVDVIEPHATNIDIKGYSMMYHLTSRRSNKVYEKQSAGDIVKELVKSAGLDLKDSEDGISLPMYTVDDTRNIYSHVHDLAIKCGFDLFVTADGKVIFKAYQRSTPKVFKYGRDILSYAIDEPVPVSSLVKVFGESPVSFKGQDTAAWKAKRAVEGVAGQGGVPYIIEDPVIRDKDTADKVAKAQLERIQTPLAGSVTTLGNARIGPGDTIQFKEVPDKQMNDEFAVIRVNHSFSKERGFLTTTGWVKKMKISSPVAPLPSPPAAAGGLGKPPSALEEQLAKAEEKLEEARLRLLDVIETGEVELERALVEMNTMVAGIDKAAKEMLAAADEVRKKAMDAAKEALDKADELKNDIKQKKAELEKTMADADKKFNDYKKEAEKEIKGYTGELDKVKNEAEKFEEEGRKKIDELEKKSIDEIGSLEKEVSDVKDLQAKKDEVKKKADQEVEKIRTGMTDKKAEAEEKIKDIEGKADEARKKLDDAEKRVKEEIDEAKKKFDESLKNAEIQIENLQKSAEKITKEANEEYEKVKKKAEETRKEAIQKFEKVKKTYGEARDKVMEARKQIGWD
jgi:hypothetical protein